MNSILIRNALTTNDMIKNPEKILDLIRHLYKK